MVDFIALFIVRRRLFLGVCILFVTGFFLYHALHIPVRCIFSDLLPQDHPYVELIKKYPEFGGTNSVLIALEAKNGDIFNYSTLQKIIDLSRDVTFLQAVDRNKVCSLGVRKIKNLKITAWGIESPSVLFPKAPKDKDAIDKLKNDVLSNDAYYGKLVSGDGKVALISVGFFEDRLNTRVLFKDLERLRSEYEDENTEIHITGEPYLYGVILSYLPQTGLLFCLTVVAMLLTAYLFTRSLRLVFIPLFSAVMSGIWGIGFMNLLHFNMDPLMLVIPLLVSATALSHSIQFNWRFNEEYARTGDMKRSCITTIKGLLYPGLASIFTDAMGIILIAFIPIPLLYKVGIAFGAWSLSMIFVIVIFNPIVNLYLFPMKGAKEWRDGRKGGITERVLLRFVYSATSTKRRAWIVIGCFFVAVIIAFYCNLRLVVGDPQEGSPLLGESSVYNKDVEFIAKSLPGSMDPLLVIVETGHANDISKTEVMDAASHFSTQMDELHEITGSLSVIGLIKLLNMALYENNPNFFVFPETRQGIASSLYQLTGSSEPGDMNEYYNPDFSTFSLKFFCKDHLSKTVEKVIGSARKLISEIELKGVQFKLAGGRVGVIAATNESVIKNQTLLLVIAFGLAALFCSIFFKSFCAGILLVIPLFLANLFMFGCMAILNVGVSLQTVPVSIIAIGIGIDYGIYLLSRIKDEYKSTGGHWDGAIKEAICTSGNAIVLTGLIVIVGVIFWNFSDIKFQSQMGLLLSIVTFFHLCGCLLLLPAMVCIVKPKFIEGAAANS